MANEFSFDDLSFIEESNNIGYGGREIPCGRDYEIQNFIQKIKEQMPKSVLETRSRISPEHYRVLLAYSERMASLAVRTADVQVISNGLIALSCTLNHAETNETTPVLSLLHRSAVIICSDVNMVFKSITRSDDHQFFDIISDYLNRSDEDKSISVMGYREGTDMVGFRYIRTW